MILVTGSTGLVGAHLMYDLLKNGYEVKALVRKSSNKNAILQTFRFYSSDADELFKRIHWVEGDVTDIISLGKAFEGVEYVYHTAAFVSFGSCSRKEIFEVNVEGTANVVNLCLEKKIRKLCHVSSIAALGVTDDGSPIHEDVAWKPVKNESAYSVSKFKAEMEVWRGITEGLNAVIVNPSVILGPGDWKKSSTSIVPAVSKGLPFYTTGATGFVDVRDVTFAMISLMTSNITNERFLLSSGNVSYKDLLDMIASAFHTRPPRLKVPKWLLKMVWYFEVVRAKMFFTTPGITKETINMLFRRFNYTSDKIKRTINIEFIPIKQTISELCIMYQESHRNVS
jgi:dihydroflavonol-4-reductase